MSDIREHILTILTEHDWKASSSVRADLPRKVSRVYVAHMLHTLVGEGRVEKRGHTRGAVYRLVPHNALALSYKNRDLEEHVVQQEIETKVPVLQTLPDNVHSIFTYAFSEMLNNAIEHSRSKDVSVSIDAGGADILCTIHDHGIGVFRNVRDSRNLKNETEAIQDILKGKTTTMPRSHSGEGIFFTSKAVQLFELRSFGYVLRIDNTIPDVFVGKEEQPTKGTLVHLTINKQTPDHLNDLFTRYTSIDADSDFGFDRTEIQIKLYTVGGVFVSRSQARRVLSGLEKFKSIVLDFDKVPMVGQAFADEIFRVFQSTYPHISITSINMNDAVRLMVKRVEKPDSIH